ncbi:MAG: lactonase family protein, partial [Verrucomicrobiae bacterium]|nr:lactonase family protein [Verrucomicrobiae bacterium]
LLPTLASAAETFVYFGTYTGGKSDSQGIYVSRFDLESGALSEPQLAAEVSSPSFVAIHPNRGNLYAVSEKPATGSAKEGTVTVYSLDPESGALTKLNERSTGGAAPCHVSVAPSGDAIVVANYTGGSCASFGLADDGSFTEAGSFHQHEGSSINPKRQKEPHAHSANFSWDGRFVFVADLGTDRIETYRFDAGTSQMSPTGVTRIEPGSGPRHFAFHPNGKFAWVINEMALTLTGFRYEKESGTLTEIQTISTVPDNDRKQPGLSTAEVQVHPSGKFVYGSNRGHDTIAVFRLDESDGQLAFVEVESIRGKTPRNFTIDPTGRYLLAAGQDSDTVHVFAIDQNTGALSDHGSEISVPSPVCVRFLPLPRDKRIYLRVP